VVKRRKGDKIEEAVSNRGSYGRSLDTISDKNATAQKWVIPRLRCAPDETDEEAVMMRRV
jgi:hypothetical protein